MFLNPIQQNTFLKKYIILESLKNNFLFVDRFNKVFFLFNLKLFLHVFLKKNLNVFFLSLRSTH